MDLKEKIAGFSFNKDIKDVATILALRKSLADCNNVEQINDIQVNPLFDISRPEDFWYRGGVVSVLIGHYNFTISAIGDQRYYLSIVSWKNFERRFKGLIPPDEFNECERLFRQNVPIVEYINKGDDRWTFYDAFGKFFKTNAELIRFTEGPNPIFDLRCENNNWLETEIFDSSPISSNFLSDVMEGYDIGCNVIEEIVNVVDNHKSMIDYIKQI